MGPQWLLMRSGEEFKLMNRFYHLPYVFRMINSRRLRLTVLVDRMDEGNCVLQILTGKLTGETYLAIHMCR